MTSLEISTTDPSFELASGKIVILTGGATGIGAAAVRAFSQFGAVVYFLDTNKDAGEKLEADLGSNVNFFQGSVTNWNEQLHVFEHAVAQHGRVDIVVANAGVDEAVEDVFRDVFDEEGKLKQPKLTVVDVNLNGVLYTTKLALSYFRRLNTRGSLLVTGSAASYLDTPGIPVYSATKHGVIGLVRSLRDTLVDEGLVRVNAVAPWFTRTPLTDHVLHIWQQHGLPFNEPEDVATAIAFLALNSQFNGKSIYVAGGNYTELEDAVQSSRDSWLGKHNTAWVDQRKANHIKLGSQKKEA